jgi:hypothetical protein
MQRSKCGPDPFREELPKAAIGTHRPGLAAWMLLIPTAVSVFPDEIFSRLAKRISSLLLSIEPEVRKKRNWTMVSGILWYKRASLSNQSDNDLNSAAWREHVRTGALSC